MSRRRLGHLTRLDKETIKEIEENKIKPDFFDMLNICEVLDTSVYFYMKERKT